MKKILTLILLAPLGLFAIVRGSIDMGSGGMKVTVADVDTKHNQIVEVYDANEYLVPFRRDMEVSGQDQFSEEVQQLAIDTLRQVQKDMAIYEPKEWSGIATAAARRSKNADRFFDRVRRELGIDIQTISQEEEGRIGFSTAIGASKLPKETIVAYDSGSGSFQLTTEIDGKLEVVQGDFAYIAALSTLIQEIRKQSLDQTISPNPISQKEAARLITLLKKRLPKVSETFAEKLKLKSTTVVGFGNENFIFATGSVATNKETYTREDLWKAICEYCNHTDDELQQFARPQEAVLGMILLYSVMDGLNIDQLTYCYANGSCEGLLIDPKYWEIID